jgi:hypothetical protein
MDYRAEWIVAALGQWLAKRLEEHPKIADLEKTRDALVLAIKKSLEDVGRAEKR